MKNLTTAMLVLFNATPHNAFYTSVSGKLYKERAPQNAVLPYVVFHIISDVYECTFTSDFERIRIQFDLFSSENSSSQVEDMYTNLKALFDWATLTITENVHLYMRRELARLSKDPEEDVWRYIIDYEIMMEKA